ncbi:MULTISPECIES: hypothetical protein [Dyella]|uniref:Uncharacterized protein n=2 Tax=Dyella TaxID=231454 RepID=A0A4R0YZL7_9GAMM|nr:MULTISPECIES: hypothetical protein [Dyella]TBR39538.1 hypothetical protein EYV96_04825 [Dyella terrae]TCI12879.1 hypothetical protein EZM97_06045 [Dyella soli]
MPNIEHMVDFLVASVFSGPGNDEGPHWAGLRRVVDSSNFGYAPAHPGLGALLFERLLRATNTDGALAAAEFRAALMARMYMASELSRSLCRAQALFDEPGLGVHFTCACVH